jgi:hypothetical protein
MHGGLDVENYTNHSKILAVVNGIATLLTPS